MPDETPAIVRTPRHDCRVRVMSPTSFKRLATAAATDVDYGNFNHEAAKLRDADYNRALHQVWELAFNLLDDRNQTTLGGDR